MVAAAAAPATTGGGLGVGLGLGDGPAMSRPATAYASGRTRSAWRGAAGQHGKRGAEAEQPAPAQGTLFDHPATLPQA